MALLHYSLNNMLLLIVHIISYSIVNGTVLDKFKVVRVGPFYKKGNRIDFVNYKSISFVGI